MSRCYIGPKLLIIVTKEQDGKIRALAKERHQKINAVVRELLERGIRSLNNWVGPIEEKGHE